MAIRFGPGPVFVSEWRATSRRWQGYATRSAFVSIVLAGMAVAWLEGGGPSAGPNRLAAVGRVTTMAIVGVQLALVLLIAPASTAGSVCDDRASGALTLLLTTDLSSAEVVLGKLAARLVPVLGLVLCILPVAATATLLGGADPDALVRAAAATMAVAVLGGTSGLLMSVWAGRTQEALLAVFAAWAFWLLAGPACSTFVSMPAWVDMLHPFFLILAPFGASGRGGWGDVLVFSGVVSASSGLLVALAIASVRSAERREAGPGGGRSGRGRGGRRMGAIGRGIRLGPRPSLDGNPVLWREWHRRRPSRWGRAVWWTFGLASAAFTVLAVAMTIDLAATSPPPVFVVFGIAFQASIGLLLLAVSASTSMAEERARGSLDVLMAAPLPTRSIVWGKWWGAIRPLPWLALPPVLIAASVAMQTGAWAGPLFLGAMMMAFGAAIVSLGIALATQFRRPGRAVAMTVALYLVPTVAWFFLILVLRGEDDVGSALLLGSRFYAAAIGLVCAFPDVFHSLGDRMLMDAMRTWVVAYALAAVLLQATTLMTFDRCLGRMPERPGRRRPARAFGRRDGA